MPQAVINGIGIAGIRGSSSNQVSFDTDAQAFITAASLTSSTQTNAVNDLVLDLKAAGLWTKMKALYPMVGGTSLSHKWNLKDPRDLDAAFRLSFQGGWTHSSTGAKPNGTDGYADTNLVPNTSLSGNNHSLSIYSRTNNTFTGYDMACQSIQSSSTQYGYMLLSAYNGGTSIYQQQTHNANTVSVSESNTLGLYQGSRTSSTSFKAYKNGVVRGTNTNVASSIGSYLPVTSIVIGAFKFLNNSNITSVFSYSNRETAFASIGNGLTDIESNLFYQIVEKFQAALGRNVNATQPFYFNRNYSNEVNAFIFNGGITDATQISATNTLVNTLKTAGIWTKMKAVYPMVGGTATAHKFNLVNPGTYNLTFNGGGTHDSNGYQTNGSNALADTNLTPSTTLTLNSTHVSIYSRTNSVGNYTDIGTQDGSGRVIAVFTRWTGNEINTRVNEGFTASVGTNNDSRGFYIASRTASNVRKTYINNTLFNTNSTPSVALPTTKIGIGGNYYNNNVVSSNYFSNRQYAFASIGDGLTDAEALTFYNAVQAFQTTLGRQV